jgi:hypothetical protein
MSSFRYGLWHVEWQAHDGGRLSVLRFGNQDLVTASPALFQPPVKDYGRYETRPVHGYDDCFPTVDPCIFPADGWSVPDHGELCWLPWDVDVSDDRLICQVKSERLPVVFRRNMSFQPSSLSWLFEVVNTGDVEVPFLHVMHGLMPLREIAGVRVPAFAKVIDEATGEPMPMSTPRQVEDLLMSHEGNKAWMLLLQRISSGRAAITFRSGLNLEINFPVGLFPTLGIWWNDGRYPNEESCRRFECALEPVPGTCSSLAKSYREGASLLVPPRAAQRWTITWEVNFS